MENLITRSRQLKTSLVILPYTATQWLMHRSEQPLVNEWPGIIDCIDANYDMHGDVM